MRYFFIQLAYPLLFLFAAISPYAFPTTELQASDIDYYIHDNASFSFIFSKSFLKEKKKDFFYIYKKLHYYSDIYNEVFSDKLKKKPIYIFASPKNQISNASTNAVPFLRVIFFPTGVDHIDTISSTSWEDLVIAHEMAHIFQLGQTSDHLKYLNPIFGTSEVIFLPIPIFLNVNMAMPSFLLEGHATFSESLFAPGGRLYSGLVRALVFSQIKHKFQDTNQFIKHYIINITRDTFSKRQQYFHGGYFFNSLLKKYDIKKINSIFRKHAEHFIVPLSFISIKNVFESVFGNSFESLINHYIQTYLPLAVQQKKSVEKALFHSRICPPFNKKNNKVFFLNSNLNSTPILRTLNLSTGKWKKRKKIFKPGKVFKIKKRYYVSSSDKINTTERAYGLFSEGMYLKNYKSQKVQDIYKNQVISIDTSNNMNGFRLNLNRKFYDTVNSSAIFGPEGEIYYFKQKGNERIMYKNKQPLFQFKGFYGKPIEAAKDGTVYFISSTLYGSSLFAWDIYNGIYRVSSSDVVVDAVKVHKDRFLICEIEPDFYSYKLIYLEPYPEQPVFYDYPFDTVSQSLSTISTLSLMKEKQVDLVMGAVSIEDSTYLQQLKEIDNTPDLNKSDTLPGTLPDKSDVSAQSVDSLSEENANSHDDITYSRYSSLWQIHFTGLEMGLFYDPITGYNGLVSVTFKDPLEYNSIRFTYQRSLENWLIQSQYTNQVYRLRWDIQHTYKEGLENFFGSRTYAYIHELSQGFSLPLFKFGYWQSDLYWKNAVSSLAIKNFPNQAYYFSTEPFLQLQYKRTYSQNVDFHRKFFTQASLQYRVNLSNNDSNWQLKTKSYYTMHWGWEFYTTPFFTYQTAIKPKSIPFRYFKPLNADRTLSFLNSLSFPLEKRIFEETNDYLSSGLNIQKFIETPVYFARFPVSLVGLTPIVSGKYVQFFDNDKAEKMHFLEWIFGIKVAVLTHHKVKFKLYLHSGYSHLLNSTTLVKEKSSFDLSIIERLDDRFHFGVQLQSDF